MKALKTLVATLGLAATAAIAQTPAGGGLGGPGGVRGFDIERLAVLLDLDAYQKQEVERVLTEQRETMQAERKARDAAAERPSIEEMRSLREQARESTITKLQTVLTELQITKLKLLMERPADGRIGRRGPPPEAG
jgi:hypothetical protein